MNVEVWLEKEALAGVLVPTVVEECGLNLHVTRGYASVSYLQSAADFIQRDGRPTYVYLLTDFDPSGLRHKGATTAVSLVRVCHSFTECSTLGQSSSCFWFAFTGPSLQCTAGRRRPWSPANILATWPRGRGSPCRHR